MKKLILLGALCCSLALKAQMSEDSTAFFIRELYNIALTEQKSFAWLHEICTEIGPRLSGSPQYDLAATYTRNVMDSIGLRTKVQPCKVPQWERGPVAYCQLQLPTIKNNLKTYTPTRLAAVSLGNAVGTPEGPITAPWVMVSSTNQLDSFGIAGLLKDKIVFMNQPMDPIAVNTFEAYGKVAGFRARGPGLAGNYGALGVVIRSLATQIDDYPHTGVTVYDNNKAIPAIAISTRDAEFLQQKIQEGGLVGEVFSGALMRDSTTDDNVVGEWKGSLFPNRFILVGGHLDSWDLGQGAHDDGAGCVQAIEALYLLKKMGYTPRHSLRAVMFANEENGLAGGTEYAQRSNAAGETHVAAIEADRGGFTPNAFTFEGHETVAAKHFARIATKSKFLEPYGVTFKRGGSGADISTLRSQMGLLIGLATDSQRYFDVHHAATDTIKAVHPRELSLGGATLAALIFLIDQEDW